MPFSKMSLPSKIALMAAAGLLALGAAVIALAIMLLDADAERRASEQQDANMRIAWNIVRQSGWPLRVEADTLHAGDHPFDSTAIVDLVSQLTGGTATVFLGDRRIATTIRKPDGSRAVGTSLAAGPARDAVLGQGKPFRGEAAILGVPYLTAYDPILDDAGKAIGILYVGVPKADLLSSGKVAAQFAIVGGAITMALTLAVLFASRCLFAPLSLLCRTVQTLVDAPEESADMRVAWSVLAQAGLPLRVEGETLYAGTEVLNASPAVVDRITALTGASVTLFVGDRRVATNVLDKTGQRALGTVLARGPAHDAVFGRGEPFRGEADVLGVVHQAAYDPILDPAGRVVGAVYVGIPKTHAVRRGRAVSLNLASLSLPAAVLVRKDEIGAIARVMGALKQAAIDSLTIEQEASVRHHVAAATGEIGLVPGA